METYPVRMFVRMTPEGLAQAKALAESVDMTLSELVRMLLRATRPGAAPESLIVVDRNTAVGLRRELRRWGYHYNQAVHALNAIAYYLRLDEADAADALEELGKVSRKLESMDAAVSKLREDVAAISEHPIAFS